MRLCTSLSGAETEPEPDCTHRGCLWPGMQCCPGPGCFCKSTCALQLFVMQHKTFQARVKALASEGFII